MDEKKYRIIGLRGKEHESTKIGRLCNYKN